MRGYEVLGPLRQNGYVVTDMDAALTHWVDVLGIGPWHVYEHLPVEDFSYRGTPATIDMTIALSQQGSLQLELIAQHDEQPSVYLDFLELNGGRGGLHHLAFWPDDMDVATAKAHELGWELGMQGRVGPAGWFKYFLTEDHGGTVMELASMRKQWWLEEEAERGLHWTGADGQPGIIRHDLRSR
jgi:catechol 2,3-dioxygenase-like lactoylglutathione lyase family enzyme